MGVNLMNGSRGAWLVLEQARKSAALTLRRRASEDVPLPGALARSVAVSAVAGARRRWGRAA